jgi:hypothetical protein
MIIGINGYSGSGKDAVGAIIQKLCPNENWEIKKFAGKLKEVASILTSIPVKYFEDQEFKKEVLSEEWWTTCDEGHQPMTVRDLLQKLGTECMRTGLHSNTWVNALMVDYKPAKMDQYNPSKWVVTDTRFPNEAKAIKDKGGVVIRIDRPGIKPINNHPSEVGLDYWDFDYAIGNVSDLVSLEFTIENILKEIKIL